MEKVSRVRHFPLKFVPTIVGLSMTLLPAVGTEAKPNNHDGFFLQMDIGLGSMASPAHAAFSATFD